MPARAGGFGINNSYPNLARPGARPLSKRLDVVPMASGRRYPRQHLRLYLCTVLRTRVISVALILIHPRK